MQSSSPTPDAEPRPRRSRMPRSPRWSRAGAASFARRFVYFWIVWSALLLVHEGGHAVSAWHEGLDVRRVTVGVGPELWRGEGHETEFVLRALPVAGMTTFASPPAATGAASSPPGAASSEAGWSAWGHQALVLAGGVLATVAVAFALTAMVAVRERLTRARWILGRMLIADAVVLTVFNFLPVPPLDGGRALLGAVAAWRGAPLAGDALFWVHVGGLALAVVPMTLWTSWTSRIDAITMWWGAPRQSPAPRGHAS